MIERFWFFKVFNKSFSFGIFCIMVKVEILLLVYKYICGMLSVFLIIRVNCNGG